MPRCRDGRRTARGLVSPASMDSTGKPYPVSAGGASAASDYSNLRTRKAGTIPIGPYLTHRGRVMPQCIQAQRCRRAADQGLRW